MPLAKEFWARFRRWLHLLGHLLALPVSWMISGENGPHIHRAETVTRPIIFIARESGHSLALNEVILLGCTCGKVFAQEAQDGET